MQVTIYPINVQKNHVQILYILGYKRNKFSRCEYVYFKSINFIRFFYFCEGHNTKNFVIKFRILVDYIINYLCPDFFS
jgi:hypothetical protein